MPTFSNVVPDGEDAIIGTSAQGRGAGPALARLAALTGRATATLRMTLPSLGTACADRRLSSTTVPLINAFSSADIRGHCQQCIGIQLDATRVGGVERNKPRMRDARRAALGLAPAPAPAGCTVTEFTATVYALTGQDHTGYSIRQAAYDLRKLRGKRLTKKLGSRLLIP